MKITMPAIPDIRTRDGLKKIVHFFVARATQITVTTIIQQNVDTDELSNYKTAGVVVGSYVIGEMVADATKPFVDKKIDEYADHLAEAKKEAAEKLQELETQNQ